MTCRQATVNSTEADESSDFGKLGYLQLGVEDVLAAVQVALRVAEHVQHKQVVGQEGHDAEDTPDAVLHFVAPLKVVQAPLLQQITDRSFQRCTPSRAPQRLHAYAYAHPVAGKAHEFKQLYHPGR